VHAHADERLPPVVQTAPDNRGFTSTRLGYRRRVPLRVCAICGLLSPLAFIIGWAAGGLAQPDAYSLVDDSVSDLGALTADQAWIYNQLGANLTGLLVAALAYGLWRVGIPGRSGRIGVIALAVMGIGQFFDGWFRLECRAIDAGCSGGGTGWQVVAHEIESLFTVLGLLVSVFALARAFKTAERWRDLRTPTLIAGSATVSGTEGHRNRHAADSVRRGHPDLPS